MTRLARAIAVTGVALAAVASGAACSVRDAAKDEAPAANAAAAQRPPAEEEMKTRDRETPEGELTIMDRFNAPDPRLTVPPAFRGNWAPSQTGCGVGGEWVSIEPGGYRAPDSIAVLLEPARVVRQTAPGGEAATTITPRIAQMSEGEMGRGRVRMSRVGDYLYMSNPSVVSESDHWQYRNIRCPDPRRAAN